MAIKFLIVSLGLWLIYSSVADKSPLSVFGTTPAPNSTGSGGSFVPVPGNTGGTGGGGFGARSTAPSATTTPDVGITGTMA